MSELALRPDEATGGKTGGGKRAKMNAEKARFSTFGDGQRTDKYLEWLLPLFRGQLRSIASEVDNLLAAIQRLENITEQHAHGSVDLERELSRIEVSLIQMALSKTHGHQRKAAAFLQIKPTTLNAKIKKYAIQYRKTESKEAPTAFTGRR